jgi:hypothetical protein
MTFKFKCSITSSDFMEWGDTTLRTIHFGRLRKAKNKRSYTVTYTALDIPAVYHRLVGQLIAEEAQGQKHNSHESRRRQMYARQVLDAFAEELLKNAAKPLEKRVPPASFRSHTLTPILQRQLRAVHDAYMPSVNTAMIKMGEASLTLSRVTEIYVHQDPTLAYLAPRYRRHLLYVPEPRWYLAILINPARQGDPGFYYEVREHHEQILMAIREDEGQTIRDSHGMPILRRAEVRAIILEGLEDCFAQELSAVVLPPTLPHCHPWY